MSHKQLVIELLVCILQLHHNLVGSPFIYADPNAAGAREFDIEYSRWGQPGIANSQFVVQPYTTNKEHRFKLIGEMYTHRIRWSGSSSPDQVQFETWSVAGQQVHAWTNTGELHTIWLHVRQQLYS